jgi:YD repeat-containing protein
MTVADPVVVIPGSDEEARLWRLVREVAASNTTSENLSTRCAYDEAGNLVEMIDASGDDQTYTYDALGRLTGRTDGLGATVAWMVDVRTTGGSTTYKARFQLVDSIYGDLEDCAGRGRQQVAWAWVAVER